MKLTVVGTGSKGNCYILSSDSGESLIVEAGAKFLDVKKNLDFNLRGVVGCVLSHCHIDHSKYIRDYVAGGIDLYTSKGTLEALKLHDHYRSHAIRSGQAVQIGSFKVLPFDTVHDVAEPHGYLIKHEEMGTMLFLTDTHYSKYKFNGVNFMVVEANFCEDILDAKSSKSFLRERILNSHMSLQNLLGMLDANDTSKVAKIVLIHLSDSNSNEAKFVEKVQAATGIPTFAANNGEKYELNINPF